MKLKTILQIIQKSYSLQTGEDRYGVEWFAQPTDEYLVISFRGSQFTGNMWYYDLLRNLCALIPCYSKQIGWASLGYVSGANDVIDDIVDYITQNNQDNKPVIICGHSLGAAISYLTALLLTNKGINIKSWIGVGTVNCMITRQKNITFKCLNYKYEEDIVPIYPPRWLGFTPPVDPIHIGKDDSNSLTHVGDFNDHKLTNYIQYAPDVEV